MDGFEKFTNCLDSLNKTTPSIYDKGPESPEKWFQHLTKVHKEIRDKLGGERKEFFPCLLDTKVEITDYSIVIQLQNILRYIPNYLKDYGLTLDDLIEGKIKKCHNIKVGKHILGYLTRKNDISEWQTSYIKSELAHWGNLLKQPDQVQYKDDLAVVIDTSAEAYALAGRYECDKGSCFAHGKENSKFRWNIGSTPNTFVVLFKDNVKNVNLVRMIGFYVDNILNFCSPYPIKSLELNIKTIESALSLISKKLLKCKDLGKMKDHAILIGNAYSHMPSFSFFTKKTKINDVLKKSALYIEKWPR